MEADAGTAGAVRAAAATLQAAGIDTPLHDAKLLCAESAGCGLGEVDRAMLMGERLPLDRERFESMVARRAAREPLQYIVGHAPFRWLDLDVGPGVFIPRPETEAVVQAGLDWLHDRGTDAPRVVDLCAGSGAIGLSVVTELPGAEVWAVERDDRAIVWTRRNARAAGTSRYHLVHADATAPGTLAELDGTVDAVITNPPYVPLSAIPEQPEVRDHDPATALYGGSADGLLIPERIVDRAVRLLRPGGLLVMEHDIGQGPALVSYALSHGFDRARTGEDWTGRPRYLSACRAG